MKAKLKLAAALCIACATWLVAAPALSQEAWPSRPVKLVVPSSPGGGTDWYGRFLAQALSENLKQQFVEGDYAYIWWTAKTADNDYELATDTLVVREGKIVAQSFTAKMTPKS